MTQLRTRKPGAKTLDYVSDDNPLQVSVRDVQEFSTNDLLLEVILQLQIQNAHLALITGDEINVEDIEDAGN